MILFPSDKLMYGNTYQIAKFIVLSKQSSPRGETISTVPCLFGPEMHMTQSHQTEWGYIFACKYTKNHISHRESKQGLIFCSQPTSGPCSQFLLLQIKKSKFKVASNFCQQLLFLSGLSTIHQDSHRKDSSKEKEVGKRERNLTTHRSIQHFSLKEHYSITFLQLMRVQNKTLVPSKEQDIAALSLEQLGRKNDGYTDRKRVRERS